MSRLLCGLCQRTVALFPRGKDIVVVCVPCKIELRRELNGATQHFRADKRVGYLPRRAA